MDNSPIAKLPQQNFEGVEGSSDKSESPNRMSLGKRRLVWILGILLLLGVIVGVVVATIKFGPEIISKFQSGNSGQTSSSATPSGPLELTAVRPTRSVSNNVSEVTIISNNSVTVGTNARYELQDLGEHDGKFYYILRVKNLETGDNKVSVEFTDSADQKQKIDLNITKKNFTPPVGFTSVLGWPDSTYVVDGDDYAVTVDKKHKLLEDYEPSDLVDLNKQFGIYTYNDAMLRAEAARMLNNMLDALAKETGKYVTVASGYRSYEAQVTAYTSWVKQLGEAQADRVSAKPGHSQHQLGTTLDFVSDETNWQINSSFGNTTAGKWLAENCERFGFILPYKQDQSNDGGYAEESWHFRFTGLPEGS